MRWRVNLVAVGVMWLACAAHQAGGAIVERDFHVAGDKLLTFDTESGREWLDVTTTYQMSLEEVNALLGDGGALADFSLASYSDVVALLTSAGFDPSHIPGEQDYDQSIAFVDVVSGLHASGGIMSNLWYTAGHVDTSADGSSANIVVVCAYGDKPVPGAVNNTLFKTYGAGINHPPFVLPTLGYWLYRSSAVPEPGSGWLLSAAAVVNAFGWRSRTFSQRRFR